MRTYFTQRNIFDYKNLYLTAKTGSINVTCTSGGPTRTGLESCLTDKNLN